jgi:hypothetical protein
MINALHLLWIIPLFAFLGFVLGAIMSVGKEREEGEAPW